jgi:hypothetical protein
MFKKITKFLSSLRFTIWLISLLALIFALGLWIPQKRLLKEWYFQWKSGSPKLVAFCDALQLTDIYTSPLTLLLWVLFFVNLSLVLWQRLPLIKKRIALTEAKIIDPASAAGYSFRASYPLPAAMTRAGVLDFLKKHGFALIERDGLFYGVKNRLSPIAFGLFHLSFFLILIGGVVSMYTEFYGYLEVVEGESFQGELDHYSMLPAPPSLPRIGSPPQVSFTLKKIVPTVSGFTETGLRVDLVDKEGKEHHLDINKPYKADSSTFALKDLGMAPLFVLTDPGSHQEIDGAYTRLDCLKGRSDHFALGGYQFRVKFYPDYLLTDGKASTRSLEFNNPVFALSIGKGQKKIGDFLLPRNGSVEFDGKRLEMRAAPFWVRFVVMKEHGIPALYTGFLVASLAVVWRFIWFRREIVGRVREDEEGSVLVIAGRSEFYQDLAEDEFSALFEKLGAG